MLKSALLWIIPKSSIMANKRIFIALWACCIVGSLAVIPYIYHLGVIPESISLAHFFFAAAVQTALLYALILSICYVILPKTDLEPFRFSSWFKEVILPGLIGGAIAGLLIQGFSLAFFHGSVLAKSSNIPLWTTVLASLYGAINEEVLLRLFLFTFVYFLLGKILYKRNTLFWITNCVIALAFGLGHLPVALKLIPPSTFEITRILVLNFIPGFIFGWLYWSYGFFAAAFAHFCADILIYVAFR